MFISVEIVQKLTLRSHVDTTQTSILVDYGCYMRILYFILLWHRSTLFECILVHSHQAYRAASAMSGVHIRLGLS